MGEAHKEVYLYILFNEFLGDHFYGKKWGKSEPTNSQRKLISIIMAVIESNNL